jgi:hypothetical protein
MMWGFWEGAHWRPRAALWNRDWSLRPHGQVWVDLVTKEWWTNTGGRTDARGGFATRGFCGDYEVTVEFEGKTASRRLTLTNQGAETRIPVD